MANNAYEEGLELRKRVLGSDYVAKTLENTDEFFLPFQELLTEFGWGRVWSRPGLDLKTRSMLTLAFCIALNRQHEIRLHLRGALRNGVSREEIRELVIHSFVYCGGPASLDAYNVVRSALPEIEAQEKANAEVKPTD